MVTELEAAPADMRTPAQKEWPKAADRWVSRPAMEEGPILENMERSAALAYAVHLEIAELRDSKATTELVEKLFVALEAQAKAINAITDHTRELQATVEDLVAGGTAVTATLEAVQEEPQVRVRLQHSHTLKEGWRLSESTVEWTGAGHPDWHVVKDVMGEAHEHGTTEADNRRRIESGDQS